MERMYKARSEERSGASMSPPSIPLSQYLHMFTNLEALNPNLSGFHRGFTTLDTID